MMQHAEGTRTPTESMDSQGKAVREITPTQAWELLQNNKALLVDVRTEQELPDYGKPELSSIGGKSLLLPWRLAPDFEANPHFIDQLKAQATSDMTLLFMCKLGGRSFEATQYAQEHGYQECYNVIGGMEGEHGWKASNLAWGGAS